MTPVTIPDFPLSDQDLLEAGMHVAKANDFDMAEKLFLGAVSLNGRNHHALGNLGTLLSRSNRLDEAQEYLTRAIAMKPSHAVAWAMLATVYNHKDQFLDARLCDQRAIEIDPSHAEFHKHLAGQWEIAGNWEKAEESYKTAIDLAPSDAYIRVGWGILKLLRGDYSYGLPLYEVRVNLDESHNVGIKGVVQHPIEIFARWNNYREECQQIVIEAEQGVGDLFQMSRYGVMLQRAFPNAVIVLRCFPEVVDLMKRFSGFHDVIRQGEEIERSANSFSVAVMSLPYLAVLLAEDMHQSPPEVNLDKLPDTMTDYRFRDPAAVKVGICWKGNPSHGLDRFRSIPFPIFKEGIPWRMTLEYVNLQYNYGEDDVISLVGAKGMSNVGTWEETLATISKLDVVVTVDTAVAHLAGTIGKPTLLLVATLNDWRWGLEKETTPWYPNMRIIRQKELKNWAPVMDTVRESLQRLISPAS